MSPDLGLGQDGVIHGEFIDRAGEEGTDGSPDISRAKSGVEAEVPSVRRLGEVLLHDLDPAVLGGDGSGHPDLREGL